MSRVAPVILLVLRDEAGNLRFMAHPNWRAIVQAEDLEYIDTLLRDFLERANLHPDVLFKHISSLAVGPLVTQEVGVSISGNALLLEQCSHFVQF